MVDLKHKKWRKGHHNRAAKQEIDGLYLLSMNVIVWKKDHKNPAAEHILWYAWYSLVPFLAKQGLLSNFYFVDLQYRVQIW